MKNLFNILSVVIILVSTFAFLFDIQIENKLLISITVFQSIAFFITGKQYSRDIFSSWACPIYILFFSLFVVNFQTLTNVSLGFGVLGDYMFGSQGLDYLITPCLLVSVASMSCYMMSVINYKDQGSVESYNTTYKERPINVLLVIALLYFLATINIREFLTGAVYHGSGASDAGVATYGYSERFLDSMIYIAIAIYSYNIKKENVIKSIKDFYKRVPLHFWVVVSVYLILRLFSGDRGPVIYILFTLLYSLIYCINLKIRLIPFLATGMVGAIIMASLSYARVQSSDISFSEKMKIGNELVSATEVPNISPFTQELAGSNICTLIMMNDIESGKTSYKYGSNVISVLINCLPGMGIIKSIIPFPDFLDVPASTTYITESANGGKDYDSGYGSTLIADYYYDLGILGCLLGFWLLGGVYMNFSVKLVRGQSLSVVSLIFLFKMASLSIYIPRSTMWATIGSTVFVIIIYYIIKHLLMISSYNN